jgi:hypothetical protein
MGRIVGNCRRSATSFSASPTANPVGTRKRGTVLSSLHAHARVARCAGAVNNRVEFSHERDLGRASCDAPRVTAEALVLDRVALSSGAASWIPAQHGRTG